MKAGEKVVEKVFSKKKADNVVVEDVVDEVTKKVEKLNIKPKKSKDLLASIYGNGLFRGKGIRRV